MKQGLITTGLNDLAHWVADGKKDPPGEKGKDCPTCPDLTEEFDEQLAKTKKYFSNLKNSFDNKITETDGKYEMARLLKFKDLTKSGSKFDLKSHKEGLFTYEKIGKDGAYYKGQLFQFDDFGNYNFGVVAKAYGYILGSVQLAAGLYQIWSGTAEWSYYKTYFDAPRDSQMIQGGYKHH